MNPLGILVASGLGGGAIAGRVSLKKQKQKSSINHVVNHVVWLIPPGLTVTAIIQDKPGWIIFGSATLALFGMWANHFGVYGYGMGEAGPLAINAERCFATLDEKGNIIRVNGEVVRECERRISFPAIVTWSSLAGVAYGIYRLVDK